MVLLKWPPEVLVSVNGSQFPSFAFKDFCSQTGIIYLRAATFHPVSNGEAERWVLTFKEAQLEVKNKNDALYS